MDRRYLARTFALLILAVGVAGTRSLPVSAAIEAEAFGRLPLYFIANDGQVDSDRVAFYIQGEDKALYFTPDGITFALRSAAGSEAESAGSRWAVKLDFLGADPRTWPEGEEQQDAVFSYFKGRRSDWRTGVPTYGRIAYRDLWPGIDLVYSGTVNELKYEFVVHPGADPGQIRLSYRGVSDLAVSGAGRLQIDTPAGSFEDDVPVAWQTINGERREVAVSYGLGAPQEEGAFPYGFDLGAYDPTRLLILDPSILVYCGYVGGASSDYGRAIAVDGQGRAYVTGETGSDESSFPVAVGPDLTHNGGFDAFVARVNAAGTALEYCGYIGGTSGDYGLSIAVDELGNAYVTGKTSSDEVSFPATVGPDLTWNGGDDAFVARVNAAGTALDYCGYIGGGASEFGQGIAVDAAGNAFVGGYTNSDEATFPAIAGPDLTWNGGVWDGFVARVNAAGTALDYCGYVGGTGWEGVAGIAVDDQGRASVTGLVTSDETTFPVAVGPDLSHNGGYDAFVARVNAAGTALEYCGYIGGAGWDEGLGIAVDGAGNALVTGDTFTDESTFPVAVGPDLTWNGGADAFVARVNTAGATLDYCGYIGGSGSDYGYAIAMDGQGNGYVTGQTDSDETTFPVKVGPGLIHIAWEDAFVARVNNLGTALDYCGYIGGSDQDHGYGIAVDGQGDAYVIGDSFSDESSFPVTIGPDLTHNGGWNDAFVARIEAFQFTISVSPDPLIAGQPATITVTGAGPSSPTWLAYSLAGPGSTPVPPLGVTLDLANPARAAGPTVTDGQGGLEWTLPIPPGAAGLNVWVQALQPGELSNRVDTSVQ